MVMGLNARERAQVVTALKPFGFNISGGSSQIDDDGSITYHFSIEKGCAANYDYRHVGEILKALLGADRIFDSGMPLV